VELEGGCGVSVKQWEGTGGIRLKAEYDDVLEASAQLGLPALEVARLAEKLAESQLSE
jgi:hypothetical protein